MWQLVIRQAAKNKRMFFSFLVVFLFHATVILAVSIVFDLKNASQSSHNMEYSAETMLATQKLLEIELKEYPITITEDDIIELIEIKKEIPKEVVVEKEVKESREKNTESNKDMPESSGISMAFKQDYMGMVIAKLSRNKYYPNAERNRGREGVVSIRFSIDPNGQARDIVVTGSSQNANLDKAAIETVRRSSPFPEFESGSGSIDISLSIDYKLEY